MCTLNHLTEKRNITNLIRLLSRQLFQEHASPLFITLDLSKLADVVKLSNLIFTHDTIKKKSTSV